MEEKSLLIILTGLVTALGVKEIWKIIKSKVDHASSIDEKQIDITISGNCYYPCWHIIISHLYLRGLDFIHMGYFKSV